MWGSCLDHVIEVEVVTADGTIQRASESENSDLFFVSLRRRFQEMRVVRLTLGRQ